MKKVVLFFLAIVLIIGGAFAYKRFNKPVLHITAINHLHKNPKTFKDTVFYGIVRVLKKHYRLKDCTAQNCDVVVDNPFGQEKILDYQDAFKIYFTPEASYPINDKEYDLILGHEHRNQDNYLRYPFYIQEHGRHVGTRKFYREGKDCQPHKKHFACMLVSNGEPGKSIHPPYNYMSGTEERESMFDLLSKYKSVVSGGKIKNNIGYNVPMKETIKWLKDCKFVIAYENQNRKIIKRL